MALVNTIKEARRAAGLTQENLSKACGIERKRLGSIERGGGCTLEEALMIALALDLDVRDMFFRDQASHERTSGKGRGQRALNLVGMIFGELKVVSRMPGTHSHRGEAFWLCECSCGGSAIVRSDHLRAGHSKSCGCRVSTNFETNNSVRI